MWKQCGRRFKGLKQLEGLGVSIEIWTLYFVKAAVGDDLSWIIVKNRALVYFGVLPHELCTDCSG
jgi:hypothetical protein